MKENKLKPCRVCGGEMKIDYQNNQNYERGYYAVCDNCGIYFGLDSEAVDMGTAGENTEMKML